MKFNLFILLLSYICTFIKATPPITVYDYIKILGPPKLYVNMDSGERLKTIVQKIAKEPKLLIHSVIESEIMGFNNKLPINNKTDFPCQKYNVPKHGGNVNELLPGDIKVVAALGDSITAGLGIKATNILELLTENKGYVYDIGGAKDAMTLVNFLRVYNPDVKGYSMKDSKIHTSTDGLNLAVSGATARDLMDQTDLLIEKLKTDPTIDFENDWKLINILIGNNDICRAFEFWNKRDFTIDQFASRLTAALDKMKREIPRAFVSIITMLDVYEVKNLNMGITCSVLHLYTCPGVAYSWNIKKVEQYTSELQNTMFSIVGGGRYEGQSDFTVVVQPFFQETLIPYKDGKPDLSYFAPDCFHLSEKGHGQVALSLWNSLFDKVNHKRRQWHAGETFDCPSPSRNPYLQTKSNA